MRPDRGEPRVVDRDAIGFALSVVSTRLPIVSTLGASPTCDSAATKNWCSISAPVRQRS